MESYRSKDIEIRLGEEGGEGEREGGEGGRREREKRGRKGGREEHTHILTATLIHTLIPSQA